MKTEEIEQIRNTAEVADLVIRRYEEDKILFYKPVCGPHKNLCPALPCPDSKHTKFHLSNKKIRIVFGGNRAGKSTLGLAELLMLACFKKHPFRKTENRIRGRYRIFGSDFAIIEKLIIPLVKEWIPKGALKGTGKTKEEAWENSWDNKYHILYLKNETMIDFMSYDQDASKSESVELDGIWADEQMPESVYSATLARLISRDGIFWMTVTPLYDISWAMKFMDSIDDSVEVFNMTIYDNPYLSEKAIREFEASVPEHEKEARLHGRFLELQGLVYKELRPDIHLIDHDEPKSSYPIIFSLDPHPRKPSVMNWAYVTPKNDVVFFDELEMKGVARDIVSAIRDKESQHPSKPLLRLIDPAAKAQGSDIVSYGTDTLREFEKEGLYFTLADNSDAGYNIVHEYLTWNASLPVGPLNRPQCFFTKNVPKTWYGMTHLLWDEWNFKKTTRDEKERIKEWKKDFPDVVRYVLAMRPTFRSFSGMNPIPMKLAVEGGLSPTRQSLLSEVVSDIRRKNELIGRT